MAAIPIPGFTQQRTQVQITSPQTIQFNPAISVITGSPSAQAPQSPASGLYQPIAAGQRAEDRTTWGGGLPDFGRALSFPVGDVSGQLPSETTRVQGATTGPRGRDWINSPVVLLGLLAVVGFFALRG